MTLVFAVLAASLLGSVHCAAMCGGFVCFYAGTAAERQESSRAFGPHAAYSIGRLAAYVMLGAAAGALGGRVDRLAVGVGTSRAAAVLAGFLMIAWGVTRIAAQVGVRVPRLGVSEVLQRPLGHAMRAASELPAAVRAVAVGLLSALLPCGWLYTFVVTAGGTGSATYGAVVMLVFWAGTLPMMLALGMGVQRAAGRLQRRLPALSAAALVVMGLLAITGHLRAPSSAAMHHGAAPTAGHVGH